jgi:hypothetical protein
MLLSISEPTTALCSLQAHDMLAMSTTSQVAFVIGCAVSGIAFGLVDLETAPDMNATMPKKKCTTNNISNSSTLSKEITTIRRILLAATEGRAVNVYESKDIASAGRWIVGVDSDNVEHITVIVATTISKLFEN